MRLGTQKGVKMNKVGIIGAMEPEVELLKREPHAGGGEQRGQDQRGDQKTERAVAEGTDRPEGHRAATAAEKKQ